MENLGGWRFESHELLTISGTIHTPVGDLDGDGDLDIAAVVSQEWEEIYVFENDGAAGFARHLIYGATNDDFGSSGISLTDLDLDGDLDVLYTNGDAFDYIPPGPRPWHGVQWLENQGSLRFAYHRIGDFPGAYFANAVDGDGDGDVDVFLVSTFNDWEAPDAASLAWFENDGRMQFVLRTLATAPTHLLTLANADLDGDGWVDLVTGAMHVYPPYDRMSRVTVWRKPVGRSVRAALLPDGQRKAASSAGRARSGRPAEPDPPIRTGGVACGSRGADRGVGRSDRRHRGVGQRVARQPRSGGTDRGRVASRRHSRPS